MKDLLILSQWLSPAFPVGAFAFSHGVETAVREGLIGDAAALEAWLVDLLSHGSGRSDVVLLASAYRAEDIIAVQEMALAFQSSAERMEETVQLGAAFCRTVRDVWALDLPDLAYPVAVGRAAALRSIALEDTAALYAQAFAANLVSAAIRLVPLGQTEGQAVLAGLQDRCHTLGADAPGLTLDDLASAAFLSDIQAMRHETLSPRIFQS
ncbi:MAG: urease accessory UreF family protein [Pseudomonadota bacterium]